MRAREWWLLRRICRSARWVCHSLLRFGEAIGRPRGVGDLNRTERACAVTRSCHDQAGLRWAERPSGRRSGYCAVRRSADFSRWRQRCSVPRDAGVRITISARWRRRETVGKREA
jgi:hypothetical protein